jgi:TPP-dependent 2-oxoacid decarboxylase
MNNQSVWHQKFLLRVDGAFQVTQQEGGQAVAEVIKPVLLGFFIYLANVNP